MNTFFRILLAAGMLAAALGARAAMGPEEARHLLNRTGFGAPLAEIEDMARLTRHEAIERLFAGVRRKARTPVPPEVMEWTDPRQLRDLSPEARKEFQRRLRESGLALKSWWLAEMLATDSPLTERMTLFWHNHFTSSLQKVRSSALLQRQNALLRRHALGSFAELLHEASKDPAMLVYLDTARNRRGQPNENFAREVMELFTLGEGRYREGDIKEAARAFTGWSLEPATGEFRWRAFLHDGGVKTVLGRSGDFRGEDVIEILLAQPATAEFVAGKLWREFVSPGPANERERADLARAAHAFRDGGYGIRVALRELLLSEAFWAPENRGALIKSPIDLVVGTLRQFEFGTGDTLPFVLLARNLGQDLFSPPNVKGWPGGEAWITSNTLLERKQFLDRIFRVDEARMVAPMMEREMERRIAQADAEAKPLARRFMRAVLDLQFSARDFLQPFEGRPMPATLQRVLLPLPPANEAALGGEGMALVRALVADPVYQLK
jgi:uncharacterized protein (DUF1800 family)